MKSLQNQLLLTSTALCLVAASTGFAQQGGPAFVEVAVVAERQVGAEQTFVGTVEPVRIATVGSAVDGRIVEFPVNEGDRVKAGDPLAQLLTETIKLELAAAEAELELRTQELRLLENGSRPEEKDQAKARMLATQARMEFAETRLKRLEALRQQRQAISAEELEQAVATAHEARNAFLEAKAANTLAEIGPRVELIAQAKARVKMHEAMADKLRDQIKKHTIVSRFNGYVVAEHTEEGAWVNRGDPVAVIAALDEVDVQSHVLESQAPFVRQGMSARVEIPALPGQVFTGTVALLTPSADARSRTFPVKVRVQNVIEEDVPLIKAGMMARVSLPTGPKQISLLAPKDAIVLGGPKPMLWVIDPRATSPVKDSGGQMLQGPVQGVPVELGVSDGDWIVVRGELKKGQYVVSKGNERVRPPNPKAPSLVMWSAQSTAEPRVSRAP